MDRERLDAWCERGIIGTMLALLLYGPLATGAVRKADFLVLQGLVVLAVGFWMVRFWVNRKHRIQWPPICWAVVGFVIYALVRYRQAEVEYAARQELLRVLVYAFVFFLVLNNLHRQETSQILTWTLLGLAVVLSVYALYQFLTNADHVLGYIKPAQYRGRGSGTYICPNHLAGFLEMVLPLALAGMFLSRASHVARVVFGYAALVILVGIGVTVSRGGMVATGLSVLVFFVILARYPGYRKTALLALLVVMVGAYVYMQKARNPQKRFGRMFTAGQLEDVNIRPSLWGAAYRMWQDHFWLGVGPAHFDQRFPAYRPPLVQSRPYWVHNDYLNTLADWGVIGGGIIAAALVCLYAGVLKTWKYVHRSQNELFSKGSDRAAHVFGVAIGLFALLVHSVVDFNMQVPANALVCIVLMASLTSHLRFATDNYWVTPRWVGRILVTLIGGAGILYLAEQWHVGRRERVALRQAERAKTFEEQVTALKAAVEADPQNSDTLYSLGETHRLLSWEGDQTNYRQLAREAMHWFDLGMRANPYEPYHLLRYGMCLDWLGYHAQAAVFIKGGLDLDPNSYYVLALQGWHQMQMGDFVAAKGWFERSLKLNWYKNSIATTYLKIVNRHLEEAENKP